MATRPQFSQIVYSEWEPEYRAALTESDPERLREKIRMAGLALFNRSQVIGYQPSPERTAMHEATVTLRALITHKLGYPHPAA